mmetsp:Transcript_4130/g.6246  ORF Transcript_4130/g.6246 Transcript_4130/m.6246 type:complete len:241 (+) Transcript_4130:124-846(+)|eukprot:CAMPEP_0202435340 /NCGR_PEP_ID=MMETSP1345-20130828/19121_1 /ASSEMBLY_ACC=CAM_ASM_000843 /TAXON_ID=342563 /ORGANISM="Fabrea Fabrea salina" /LENGTH=240 /DNA_ID=CAMNT_0049048317 /DNA_START=99 /DNA_END=821 /DNA_ORIENTATION=-
MKFHNKAEWVGINEELSSTELEEDEPPSLAESPNLKPYKVLRHNYLNFGVTYSRQRLLKRVSKESPLDLARERNYSLFNQIADILLMDEMEIAYWFCLMRKTSKSEREFKPWLIALFTGFLGKLALNKDSEAIEDYLVYRFPNFKLYFHNWQLVTDCTAELDMKEVNQCYNYLASKVRIKGFKNYDQMVRDLMPVVYRKESHSSENKSDISTISDLEMELEAFQNNMLGGEKLSPIDSYV